MRVERGAMNVFKSQASRHLVVRVHRGEGVIEALHDLCARESVSAATVTGHGLLESVRFDMFDGRSRTYGDARGFVGALELLSLSGHVSAGEREPDLHLHATVARDTDNGLQVLGGRLLEANAYAVELTLAVHDDLSLQRVPEKDSGLFAWRAGAARETREETRRTAREPEPARERSPEPVRERTPSVPPPAAGAKLSLAEVAKQLEAMPAKRGRESAELDEGVSIEKGDVLIHPTWGETEVVREDDPGQYVLRLARSGAFKTIRVDIFDISLRGARGSNSVYDLKPRRP
jgi:predicted DNA-binding protein with PD1-like motif